MVKRDEDERKSILFFYKKSFDRKSQTLCKGFWGLGLRLLETWSLRGTADKHNTKHYILSDISNLIFCCHFQAVYSCTQQTFALTETYIAPVLTGKGSAPSWIMKPSMRWVRMWDLTMAWAGLLSPLFWVLLVFPFPEVMTGAQGTPHLSTGATWQTQQVLAMWTKSHIIWKRQLNVTQCLWQSSPPWYNTDYEKC